MDLGVIRSMGQRYDATAPLKIGRFRINDDHPLNRWLSIPEIFIHSSNIGTARIADEIGMERQRAYLRKLGFMAPVDIERSEEHTSELQSLMRISYAVFCLKKKKSDT